MAYISEDLECCGINELSNITGQAPETILRGICQDWFDNTPRAFLIFSTAGGSRSGKNLAKYIKENSLGTVYKMKPKLNPNTHNIIRMWCWAVNNPGFKSLGLKKGWYKRGVDAW